MDKKIKRIFKKAKTNKLNNATLEFKPVKEFIGRKNFLAKVSNIEPKVTLSVNNRGEGHKFPSEVIMIRSVISGGTASGTVQIYYQPIRHNQMCWLDETFLIHEIKSNECEDEVKEFLKTYHYEDFLLKEWNIGSDPEVFVENKDGGIIPAFTFLGSLKKPYLTAGGLPVYWDGYQAEFQTQPNTCFEGHIESIRMGLRTVQDFARKIDPLAKLSTKTIFDIPPKMLAEDKEEHVQFGCMPSLNVYDLKGASIPARHVTFRPAGGHIHFGIGKRSDETYIKIVKALDAILGVTCVSLFQDYDKPERRELYGLPGEYRLPIHGLEYRTLSNAWLIHPTVANLVVDLARKVLCLGEQGLLQHVWNATERETIETIIKCDVNRAHEIMKRNEVTLKKLLSSSYSYLHSDTINGIYNALIKGINGFIVNPQDMEGNWNLNSQTTNHVADKRVCRVAVEFAEGKKVA